MKKSCSTNGFTLVESVVACAILALVIAGSYRLVNMSSALMRSGRNHYIAVNIAKSRAERARNFAYGDLSLLMETNVVVDGNGTPVSAGDFRRSTIIDTNYQAGITLLTVNVEIRNIRSRTFKGELETASSLLTDYLTQ
jgi:prepilin-type N-terminal cleavage/methylation domain-containing protein